ncbi:hypothetical protein I5677_02365 [Mobilitalea sibirica]|uniref:Uncharacterized protein n=1 Tax=Mobilitalea sibirica TaxID=1462919 RepID=A0A8J7H0R1_9FIRM|nr:hypothetical protein [Mobilitalea sibirica]MBH1939737.1 hypothetical protein [Mobilitalea sibirica]
MKKDNKIKSMLSSTLCMTPKGMNADELSPEEFATCYELFFDKIFEISASDITGIEGYGEFDDECKTRYVSCRDFLTGTFAEEEDGYWYHWSEMFETTLLDRDFFEKYYKKMVDKISYCEEQRFLVNNNTFFCNMKRQLLRKNYNKEKRTIL